MKKNIIFYFLWNIVLYILLFITYRITLIFDSKATKLFDIKYTLYSVIIQIIFYIIIGVWLGVLIYYSNEKRRFKEAIVEFIIIGINALLLSNFYLIEWFNLDNIFPRWVFEYNNRLCIFGSLLFGYELLTFIKKLKKK